MNRFGNQKLKVIMVAFSALVLLFTAGCSLTGSEQASGTEFPRFLDIGTAGTGGAYYPIGIAMAAILTEQLDTQATAQVTGGAVENIQLIQDGSVQLAITQARTAYAGYEGTAPYKSQNDRVRTLFGSLSQGVFQVVVRPDAKIDSVADLKGKRIAMGPAGGAAIDLAVQIFEAAGFSLDDVSPTYISYDQGVTALTDGNVDAAIVQAAIPTPAITQLAATNKEFELLSLDPELIAGLTAEYPYYAEITIPGPVYDTEEEITTLYVANMVVVDRDLPEDVVYQIVKTLFEKVGAIRESHPAAKEVSLEGATNGVPIPYHPGAKKFFREEGVLE